MKRLIALLIAVALVGVSAFGSVHVKGYYRKDGTYVHPHERSSPNKTKNDNYSTKGNVNPYTGKSGTKPRDGETTGTVSSSRTDKSPPPAVQSEKPAPQGWTALKSGMSEQDLRYHMGMPTSVEGKKDYEVWGYPTGTVYISNGKVIAWRQRKS